MAFLSQEAFEERVEEERRENTVTSWVDLDRKVYQITLIEEKFSEKFGACFLGTVIDESGEISRVWCPSGLLKSVEEKKGKYKDVFFVPNGQKKISKLKSINLFDVVFSDGEKLVSDILHYVS